MVNCFVCDNQVLCNDSFCRSCGALVCFNCLTDGLCKNCFVDINKYVFVDEYFKDKYFGEIKI